MWRVPLILAGLGLATVIAFRIDAAWGLWPLVLFAPLAIGIGLAKPEHAPRGGALLLGLAALTSALRLIPEVWPCAAACAGARTYALLFGLSIEIWGTVAGAVVAVLLLAARSHERAPWWASIPLWLVAGAAMSFLILAWRLDLACGHCRAVQSLVLAGAALSLRWAPLSAWFLVGLLGLHAAYHPQVHRAELELPETITATSAAPAATDDGVLAFLRPRSATAATVAALTPADELIDTNRLIGRADATLILDEVVDLRCAHCATVHSQLLADLKPHLAANRVAVRIRQAQYRQDPLSIQLGRWLFAAAAAGQTRHAEVVERLFGLKATDVAGARTAADPAIDLPALDHIAANSAPLIDRALNRDRSALISLRFTNPVPLFVLHQGQRELGRWQGDVVVAEVVAAIAKAAP